ncbi:MAG TPA: DUF3558 domain-containing protein [Mycobacterium sp.]
MATRLRLFAVLSALVAAVVVVWQSSPADLTMTRNVQLRSTAAPMDEPTTTIKWPVIATTDPRPFDPCEDIPIDVIQRLGLGATPPEHEEQLRCHYDSANYQMAIEPIVWRTYEESLPPDAIETNIDGHRAAWFWVMKPTDWNNKWWFSCMVTFKTSYGVIQQSLFYSPVYSNPDVDCPAENIMRAQQLAPYYVF